MRDQIVRDTENFLAAVQTPNRSFVGLDRFAGAGAENLPESLGSYITGVIGPILPMTFKLWDQVNAKAVSFVLLVNPENMNHGKTNSSFPIYTRRGYVVQLWGPNQDTISVTGKTAAFMVTGEGLTNILQRRSAGLHNLMALMAAYRNNGYELVDPLFPGRPPNNLGRVIDVIRGVELTFDDNYFMGHFNTFTLDVDAEKPYILNVNFEFICSQLDHDYKEVRGHFLPIGWSRTINSALVSGVVAEQPPPKLLSDIPQKTGTETKPVSKKKSSAPVKPKKPEESKGYEPWRPSW